MSHVFGHIECGSVGDPVGTEDRVWPFVEKFVVAYKLHGEANESRRLHRKIRRIMWEMAYFAQDFHGGDIQKQTLDGDYEALIIGPVLGEIPMVGLPIHTDGLITYAMNVIGMEHAVQSYIKNELDIMRYRVYSLIYEKTGGEIHHNSYHP